MTKDKDTTEAEKNQENLTKEVKDSWKALREISAASVSEARQDYEFEDGSVLVLRAREGKNLPLHAFASMDEAQGPLPLDQTHED